MIYNEGDKLLLSGIECTVAIVSPYGHAYLKPDSDGDTYQDKPVLMGVVFAVVDAKGKDKYGNKVVSITNAECGAV